MTGSATRLAPARLILAAMAVAAAAGGGYWLGRRPATALSATEAAAPVPRKVLYYYDPMMPAQKFDKPGKSPFMDMQLVPRYADEEPAAPGLQIDAAVAQNLGVRVVAAHMSTLATALDVTGTIDFNQRDVAIVQTRAGGFVTRVYGRAPGDVVPAGAPIADVTMPDWASAQGEYLAVLQLRDPVLAAAARRRLALLGMLPGHIARLDRTRRADGLVTLTTPVSGVIQTLDVRQGMTLTAGQTLAQVSGLGRVWLNAAVPEVQAGSVRTGQQATATLTALPGARFSGRIVAILPTAQADSRTLTVRIELANPGGRLRPGMFASVALSGSARPALLVPSEAIIRTGTRTLVMLALAGGKFAPAQVRTGRERAGQTEVLQGLAPAERVVASGQFLLDSEASLTGLAVRPLGGDPLGAAQ